MGQVVTESVLGWYMSVSLPEGYAYYIREGFSGCIRQSLASGTAEVFADCTVLNEPTATVVALKTFQGESKTDGRRELLGAISYVNNELRERNPRIVPLVVEGWNLEVKDECAYYTRPDIDAICVRQNLQSGEVDVFSDSSFRKDPSIEPVYHQSGNFYSDSKEELLTTLKIANVLL